MHYFTFSCRRFQTFHYARIDYIPDFHQPKPQRILDLEIYGIQIVSEQPCFPPEWLTQCIMHSCLMRVLEETYYVLLKRRVSPALELSRLFSKMPKLKSTLSNQFTWPQYTHALSHHQLCIQSSKTISEVQCCSNILLSFWDTCVYKYVVTYTGSFLHFALAKGPCNLLIHIFNFFFEV